MGCRSSESRSAKKRPRINHKCAQHCDPPSVVQKTHALDPACKVQVPPEDVHGLRVLRDHGQRHADQLVGQDELRDSQILRPMLPARLPNYARQI